LEATERFSFGVLALRAVSSAFDSELLRTMTFTDVLDFRDATREPLGRLRGLLIELSEKVSSLPSDRGFRHEVARIVDEHVSKPLEELSTCLAWRVRKR
jgi:hypothetical protein